MLPVRGESVAWPESAMSELGVESVEVRLLEEPPQRWLGSLWLGLREGFWEVLSGWLWRASCTGLMITLPSFNSSEDGTRDTARECVGVHSREAARLREMAAILADISEASGSNLHSVLKLNYNIFYKARKSVAGCEICIFD